MHSHMPVRDAAHSWRAFKHTLSRLKPRLGGLLFWTSYLNSHLKEQIVQLRYQNTLAPINRLPPDVFLRIAVELRPNKPSRPQSWIQFTQVCHEWRSLSISDPLLWTTIYIPEMSPHWIKVFLLRSRHAPLTVAINCALELKHPVKTLSKIMQAKGRIVELYCSGRRAPNHKVWVDKLDLSASPLKSLTISGCTLIYKGWKPTFNLQHLELKDNNFTASFISQSLTTLKLRRMNKTNLPSMSSFYKMLSSLHNLRYLTLQGLLTQIASQTRPQQFSLVPGISLPSLLSLKLYRESEEECTRFLSRATFPQLTRLHTPFKKMESTLTSLSLPYKEFHNIWSSTQLLMIGPPDESHLQLNLTSEGSLNHFEFFSSDNRSNETTRIVWMRWNSNVQLFGDLLTTLPPDKVYSVTVCWRSPSEHGLLTLASSLSTFPFLRDLRVMLVGDHKVYVDFLTDFLTSGIPSCGCVQPSGSSVEACTSCQAFSASFFPDLHSLYFDMEGREQAEMVTEMVRSTYRQFRNHRIACGRPITTTFGYYSTPLTK